MGIFRKKSKGPSFFEEEPVDTKFNVLAEFVSNHIDTKADLNRAIGAIEYIFNARQKLRGIKNDDDVLIDSKFILHDEEDK